jgi:ATP-dependent RNA helicase DHX57
VLQRNIGEGYVSGVILSAKDIKSGDTATLPPMIFPKERQPEIAEPTALEARHFAATYTLFRITSMKNTHMMMPPKYKDLWKGLFTELKKEDLAKGKAWTYEADPFLTALQREQAEKARLKKIEEDRILKAKQDANPSLVSNGKNKAWERATPVELGKRMRFDVESLVRQHTLWNANDIAIPSNMKSTLIQEIAKLGFRESHVQEAADICKDKEEVLEWLLTHVPEDDLPPWSLPENYIAGISMAASDLKKEAVIKRLASAGYSRDLCESILDGNGGDERRAAAILQAQLLGDHSADDLVAITASVSLEESGLDSWDDLWEEEQQVLSSIFDQRYIQNTKISATIQLDSSKFKCEISIQVEKPLLAYPSSPPILRVLGKIPAYIRLSITKKALSHIKDSLLGEQMIFNLVDWLEQNCNAITADPGRLSAVSSVAVAGDPVNSSFQSRRKVRSHPRPIDWTRGSQRSKDLLSATRKRESDPSNQRLLDSRRSLPAWSVRAQILTAVEDNLVTIISGETGSGKSTQSVQFVLDDLIQRELGDSANILCTQPRRISALGLADRVAEERGGKAGNEVGYIIRGDSKVKRGTTKITFMTTGVLLRRLQTSGGSEDDVCAALADVSHVFIDEVHERAVDADFLLVLLKSVLKKRKDLRVILMSATIDAEGFVKYFSSLGTVGRVHVHGRTFPVTDYYKDDLMRQLGSNFNSAREDEEYEMDEKSVSNALRDTGMKIDYDLIAKAVEHIDDQMGNTDGGILIFLPGTMEIDRTIQVLSRNSGFYALPLHASLPPAEQRKVFPPAPKGMRKIIAATNVAETSITIPDIVAVIDTGRVKETTYDPLTSTQRLTEIWASRAACAQRRGRAGRVRKGICYKLFTRNAEAKMLERPDPEITRVPLEQLCLSVKSMGVKDVAAFLASALTAPPSQAVDVALSLLSRIGAIEDDELTALGKHLAMIPADLKCAKLLVLGCTFGCIDACLSIAALLSSRSPFFNPRDKRDEVKNIRFDFAPGQGDIASDWRAFETWQENRRKFSTRDLRYWCNDNFLNMQALRDVESNRAQFVSALQEIGFLPLGYPRGNSSQQLNTQSSNLPLIKGLLAASLHPNLLSISFPATKFAASHTGALALDPEARTIKFFSADGSRAFIHPSSTCFEAKGWSSDVKYLSFWERFASGEGDKSKPYARGVTPTNVLSVLLFGGPLSVDTLGRGVTIDGWIKVRGWARIGVLIARMRRLLDTVLERRVDDPQGELKEHEKMILSVVRRLIERDGFDR